MKHKKCDWVPPVTTVPKLISVELVPIQVSVDMAVSSEEEYEKLFGKIIKSE
jgi:hypothetical protein